MARTESVPNQVHWKNPESFGDLSGRGGRRRRLPIGMGMMAIVLTCSAAGLAASGPGLGFKVGVQTLEDPIDLDETTRTRYEVELSTSMFYDEHFDLAFTFGGSSLGSFTEEYQDVVDGVFLDDTYHDDLSILDVRLAARFYPLGDASALRPYVGAGVGYFWFLDQWDDVYRDTVEVEPGVFDTFVAEDNGTDTPADGLFTFVTAGLSVPIGEQFELLFDFQYDFAKEDNGFDFGGPIYMIGGRFRF